MSLQSAQRGFTTAEILVVIAIAVMLMGVSIAAFSSFRSYFLLRTAVQDVQTAFLDARSRTLASLDDTIHGVHLESKKIVRFEGSTYSSSTPTNVVYLFPDQVTASTTLVGGGFEVMFTRLTGETQASGTIIMTEPRSGASTTIRVTSSGFIEI